MTEVRLAEQVHDLRMVMGHEAVALDQLGGRLSFSLTCNTAFVNSRPIGFGPSIVEPWMCWAGLMHI